MLAALARAASFIFCFAEAGKLLLELKTATSTVMKKSRAIFDAGGKNGSVWPNAAR